MATDKKDGNGNPFAKALSAIPTKQDQLIEELQEDLAYERDARKEDRFIFIVIVVLIFNIMIFTVMPTFGAPIAILVLELVILIPLAKRMGMQEIAKTLDRVLSRVTAKPDHEESQISN